MGGAQDKAEGIVGAARDELAKTKDELAGAQAQLSTTEGKLSDVQSSLDEAQETQQLSSFGNGIWQSGTDFLPGTYRAPGGGACYWAKLNSGDTQDIASNSIGSGQQLATIDSAFFETDGCGTWERVGE